MSYIHRLSEWPLFQWDSDQIAPLLARVRYAQGLFAQRCKNLDARMQKEAAETVLLNDAAASSALEGVTLTQKASLQALRNKSASRPGILEILLEIQQEPQALLTAARILRWHEAITGKNESSGAWRGNELGPKKIISGSLGWEKVQYIAPEAPRLAEEIKIFLAWFNFGSLPERGVKPSALWEDPLIKAAIAHFWFISIHPFNDGSARIARVICNLALLRADEGKNWYSMDERILHEQEPYFEALRSSQRDNMDITPWLDWFLYALERTVQNAERLIAPAFKRNKAFDKIEKSGLNARQQTILTSLLDGVDKQISSGAYAKQAKCSNDTALRDIQELLELGLLRKNKSGGRSTSYSLKL